MNRQNLKRFSLLALLVALLLGVPASAHPVTPTDTSRSDWFAKGPPEPNIGAIARDAAGRGEFIWSDAKNDQRYVDLTTPVAATGTITRAADLDKFAVTSDAQNISFLVKLERYTGISNNPPVQLMISIDSDAAHTQGLQDLPDDAATKVSGAAKWEYVVETQFKPGPQNTVAISAAPALWKWETPTISSTVGAAQLVSAASTSGPGSFVEIQLPWSEIGGKPLPESSLRFTVSTYYSDHAARPIKDALASRAIDVLSKLDTATELANDTIDSYVELHFSASGEVFAPLVISEFVPDPPSNPKGEWIEIYNPNAFSVNLAGYKIGDQPYRGGSQGMLQLPANRTLIGGQTILVVNDPAIFKRDNPSVPDSLVLDMSALAPYAEWGSGKISLQNTNKDLSFKESIALLDPNDTIVDMVQYAYNKPLGPPATGLDPDNRPILLTGPSVANNTSYDRCPAIQDTNDSGIDFFVHTKADLQDQPTPGAPCTAVPGIDLRISKDGPESVEVGPGATIQYIIPFSNAGEAPASSVTITDTLPSGLTCLAAAATISSGTITPAASCPAGAPLTWTVGPLASKATGTITLTVSVDQGLAADLEVVNSAGISSSPSEVAANLHNNVAVHRLITAGPPDLGVASTWAGVQDAVPGQNFTYTITYGNYGEADAFDITIADQLPGQVSFVSQTAPAGVTFQGVIGGKPTWKIPSLAYLEGGTIAMVVHLDNAAVTGTLKQHSLSIASSPADLTRAGEQPDVETASLTVANHLLFIPLTLR